MKLRKPKKHTIPVNYDRKPICNEFHQGRGRFSKSGMREGEKLYGDGRTNHAIPSEADVGGTVGPALLGAGDAVEG